jgi:hypothetical protein
MLSNYITDKYIGGYEQEYYGEADGNNGLSYLIGIILVLLILLIFAYRQKPILSKFDSRRFMADGMFSNNSQIKEMEHIKNKTNVGFDF